VASDLEYICNTGESVLAFRCGIFDRAFVEEIPPLAGSHLLHNIMADSNKIPRPKTPEDQQSRESDDKETKPADGEHVKDQTNDYKSTTTTRPVNLPLRTTATQSLARSLLSPFSPSNAGMLVHSHVRSQAPAEPIARGPEFEHGATRAMETTIYLAQIRRRRVMR